MPSREGAAAPNGYRVCESSSARVYNFATTLRISSCTKYHIKYAYSQPAPRETKVKSNHHPTPPYLPNIQRITAQKGTPKAGATTFMKFCRSAVNSKNLAKTFGCMSPNVALEPRPRSEATRAPQAVRLRPSARSAG